MEQSTTETIGRTDEARARNSDPSTSHDAARSVTNLTENQAAVLAVLRKHPGITDRTLLNLYERHYREGTRFNGALLPRQSESGIRTRRSELTAQDRVVEGQKTRLRTGRMALTWYPKEPDPR